MQLGPELESEAGTRPLMRLFLFIQCGHGSSTDDQLQDLKCYSLLLENDTMYDEITSHDVGYTMQQL